MSSGRRKWWTWVQVPALLLAFVGAGESQTRIQDQSPGYREGPGQEIEKRAEQEAEQGCTRKKSNGIRNSR